MRYPLAFWEEKCAILSARLSEVTAKQEAWERRYRELDEANQRNIKERDELRAEAGELRVKVRTMLDAGSRSV